MPASHHRARRDSTEPPRRTTRRRALEILYEAEQRGVDPAAVVAERAARAEPPVYPHTVALVQGVQAHKERIDELLSTYSVGWSLDRMPAVDRNLLRIGVFEVLWQDDVDDAVALDEAVTLARDLSTDDSPGFVNGLLARIVQVKPSLAL